MEAITHGLGDLDELGHGLFSDRNMDRCQGLLLVQSPNVQFVDREDALDLWSPHPNGQPLREAGKQGILSATHRLEIMSDVVKVDPAGNTFKEDFARASH